MKRLFFFFFLLLLACYPSFSSQASGFSHTEPNFSLQLDSNWLQFDEQGIAQLPLDEQNHLIAAFYSNSNKNFLYVRNLTDSSYEMSVFQNAVSYYNRTPKELFVEDRILKPVETMAGKKIVSFSYDFVDFSLMYETDLIRNANVSFKIITHWKLFNEQLLQFQFVTYDPSSENIAYLHRIAESFSGTSVSSDSSLPAGTPDLSPKVSELVEHSFVSKLALLLTRHNILVLVFSLLFFIVSMIAYRIWKRN